MEMLDIVLLENINTATVSDLILENWKEFGNDLVEMIIRGNIYVNFTCFSDETHFHLNGFISNQN